MIRKAVAFLLDGFEAAVEAVLIFIGLCIALVALILLLPWKAWRAADLYARWNGDEQARDAFEQKQNWKNS